MTLDPNKPQDVKTNFTPIDTVGGSLGTVDKMRPNTVPQEFGNPVFQQGGGGEAMVGNRYFSPNYSKGKSGWEIQANGDAEFQNVTVNNVQAGGVIEITVETTDDLQTALDTINTAGGGTLRLSPGTYTPGKDLTIYDNTQILGDSSGNTAIDFESSAFSLIWVGTNTYSTGTIVSVTTTAVVGDSTVWTSAMIGRKILLDERW